MTQLIAVADAEAVATRAARTLETLIAAALAARGKAHVALAGGTTPKRAYQLLSLPSWEGVELWFGDERCVGPENPDSNFRMVSENLVAPGAVVHRIEGERGAQEGAQAYAQLWRERIGEGVLDIALLGIGPDGHTASLFPLNPALDALPQVLCVPVYDAPKPPPERISLTLGVLAAARDCILLAADASKADALAAVLAGPDPRFPASLLNGEQLQVIADEAALGSSQ